MQFKASVTVPDSDGPERYEITLVYTSLFLCLIFFTLVFSMICWGLVGEGATQAATVFILAKLQNKGLLYCCTIVHVYYND